MSCEFTVDQAAKFVNGKLLGRSERLFQGVSTDTREELGGKLFIALSGENFDGHNFCEMAVQKGAAALLVKNSFVPSPEIESKVSIIKVPDTVEAMQRLSTAWRDQLSATVVGITGSNGKSSTKDFCAQLITGFKKVHVAQKSYNNHIGVPLTLLGAPKDTEVLLVEMGMNHSGEIRSLSQIAKPNIVMCTIVGRAHVGNFENGIEGVAKAKEEIYTYNPHSIMIFNHDNEYTMNMYEEAKKYVPDERLKVFSSFAAGAEVSLRATQLHLDSMDITGHIAGIQGTAHVPVFGRHNVINLMAAALVASVIGMEPEDIWANFSKCKTGWGRGQLVQLPNGAKVIFDGYNANPDSFALLIKNLYEISLPDGGQKHAVFAEMLELGVDAEKFHEDVGQMVGQADFESIFFYGPSHEAFRRGVEKAGFDKSLIISYSYEESLALKLQDMINPTDVVVMKGSRGSRIERVLKLWAPDFQ